MTRNAPREDRRHIGGDCIHLVRLRLGDDERIGIQHTSVSAAMCTGLDRHDLARGSLYALLSDAYKIRIAEIRHTVGAAAADGKQAELLEIAENDPLPVVRTAALNDGGLMTEVTTSFYRADRYEYSTPHKL